MLRRCGEAIRRSTELEPILHDDLVLAWFRAILGRLCLA